MPRGDRGVKIKDPALTGNFDAVNQSINEIPDPFYTEGRVIDIDFAGTIKLPLDQTVPHKLTGKHDYWIPIRIVSGGFRRFVEPTSLLSANSGLANTHIRLIADGICKATFLVMKK